MSEKRLLLIDTDGGTDDALAIWMLLKAHQTPSANLKVVGIVCTAGNTDIDNVKRNVLLILQAAGLLGEISVFLGASEPLLGKESHVVEPFHGYNGFGDVHLPQEFEIPEMHRHMVTGDGINRIISFCTEFRNQLSIMCLGPLTSVAMAIKIDPSIKSYIHELWLMGGNSEGIGNTTSSAEFNFYFDPESAYIVLKELPEFCPVTIVPWETCQELEFSYSWRTQVVGIIQSEKTKLLNQIESRILEKHKVWCPGDQVAATALLCPSSVKERKKFFVSIELRGEKTRGQMVVDTNNHLKSDFRVTIIRKVKDTALSHLTQWALDGKESPKFE